MFSNDLTMMRCQIIDSILITGALNTLDEHIEILKPLKYKDKNIMFLDCRSGDVSLHNEETNQLEEVNLNDMDMESLSRLADHLIHPKNWKISKAEVR